MANKFAGQILGRTVEVRFAFSGKLVALRKDIGNNVNKGEVLASLDRKLLQLELDQKLADHMVIRNKKVLVQADLDASVRDVEQAKYKLDQVDLISPIAGIILDDGGCKINMNITPSANGFVILDTQSIVFRATIKSEDVNKFANTVSLPVDFVSIGKKVFGMSSLPKLLSNLNWVVDLKMDDLKDLPIGLDGVVQLP
jgi:multidrug efflux pump subunit AcrA (membrane-fusion protein)